MKRIISLLMAVVMCLTLFAACGKSESGSKGPITVSSAGATEHQLVAYLYGYALEDAGYVPGTDFPVITGQDAELAAIKNIKAGKQSMTAFLDANELVKIVVPLVNDLLAGSVDITPDYVGTAYTRYMINDPMYDAAEMERIVREFYAENHKVALLTPSTVDSNYCIVMMKEQAEAMGIKTFQDLQQNAEKIVFGDWGFLAMPTTGRSRIEDLFGPFNFEKVMDIDFSLGFDMLDNGSCDAIIGITTDAKLSDPKYVCLEQGVEVWCRYYQAPFVRQEILDKYPEVENIINNISAGLDTDSIIAMNYKCNVEMQEVETVAREFYDANFKK